MSDPHLLIVEDDRALAGLLEWHFRREDFVVEHVQDGESALASAFEHPPDVILLDWTLDGLSGLEVCRRLRRARATTNLPIVMMTGRSDECDRIRGLETGADDYITKPFSPREAIARVRAVLRRVRPALAGRLLSYSDLEMDVVGHKVRRGGRPVALTPTEYRLLRHLLEHPERVFSRSQLLFAVWGRDADLAQRSVDVHVRRLRNAINKGAGPELIRTVRAAGYSLDDGRACAPPKRRALPV